ncbi:hypothetical protein RASY3_03170 [Ruminococcus albus SY3]|uniref:Transcriptional regulator, AbiEi antitoxin, Type IV TA system n=1 Tax=Ruminococcus albus SY3 TaxID=1341156 RepID=A0A011V5E6_RUMAL|nr:DUF6088 family protein [Ruminococcus albus]EXM40732.1 hypothetical protein RASY3_03170 [Ruminococcus albus SY3]
MLFDYLLESFGKNEPIFTSDISYENYSDIWIKKELAKLCECGQIIRYDRGIYYIPVKTPFGNSILNPSRIIERKYLSEKGNRIGFYTGITALQQAGLSTQMSNIPEIQTNNENSKLRRVKVGNQEVILRKSRVKIDNDNIFVLQFLEMMNITPSEYFDDERKAVIRNWIEKCNISQDLVTKYAPYFPDKAMRSLIESGVIFYVA